MSRETAGYDYWCLDCQKGFYEDSCDLVDHEDDKTNTGHAVYDAGHMLDERTPAAGTNPLWVTGAKQ